VGRFNKATLERSFTSGRFLGLFNYLEYLEKDFEKAMWELYYAMLNEAGYESRALRRMLREHGGKETAQRLIRTTKLSNGYGNLYQLGRLDLTVEALIHDNPRWHPLFSKQELKKLQQRLIRFGYGPALEAC
jgi:hypothetical protein